MLTSLPFVLIVLDVKRILKGGDSVPRACKVLWLIDYFGDHNAFNQSPTFKSCFPNYELYVNHVLSL